MFLEQGNEGKNDIGRWIAMIMIVLVVSQFIGTIPLQIMISLKLSGNPDLEPNPDNPLDLSAYDIDPIAGLVLLLIPFVFGLVSLLVLMKPLHERPMLSVLTGYGSFRWKKFFWGARVWFILMVFYSIVATITGFQKIELQFNPSTFFTLSVISLLLFPLQAGFEEVLFRGYLLQGFSRKLKFKWLALLVTSLIFGSLHFFNPEVKEFGGFVTIPQYIGFGIVFGICTIMDEGLELAWGMHAMNNIFLAVFFSQDSTTLQTPALFRITAFNPLFDMLLFFVISILFIFYARHKFNWPGWDHLLKKTEYQTALTDDLSGYPEDEYADDDDK
jgi:uncharacterized protein